MVISVNAWMNHPGGFRLRAGHVVDVHPLKALFANDFLWHELMHMYIAGYIVTGFLVGRRLRDRRLRGRWGRYERTALAMPLTIAALASPVQVLVGDWAARESAATSPSSWPPSRAWRTTTKGAPSTSSAGTSTERSSRASRSPSCCPCWPSTTPTRRSRGSTRCRRDRPPVNVVRFAFQTMVGIGTLLALLGVWLLAVRIRRRRLPESGGSTARSRSRARVAGRADRRLGDDRGRAPAVGRLPRDAHLRSRHRRRRHPRRLRRARASSTSASASAPRGSCAVSRAADRDPRSLRRRRAERGARRPFRWSSCSSA